MLLSLRTARVLRASTVARQARCLGIIATGDPTKSHKEKNALRGRPMSPHVTIYAFPLAAIASITHRATGVALVTGVYGMAFISLAGGDVAGLMQSIGNTTLLGMLVKIVYHTLGGVRHLYWEMRPEGLNPTTQYQSSVGLFALSGFLALVAGLM